MSQGSGPSTKSMSPQPTGFSQVHSRNVGAEGGGQGMSVLLSWHEKLVETAGLPSNLVANGGPVWFIQRVTFNFVSI